MFSGTDKIERLFGGAGRYGRLFLGLSLTALLANWAAVIFLVAPRLGHLEFLRLHYTAALGVDWVAEWRQISVFPLCGTAVFFINGFFAGALAKRHRLLGILILGATAVIETLIAVGAVIAVRLNL